MTERDKHRKARGVWLTSAFVTFAAGLLLHYYAPTLAPLIATPTSWVWSVVGFGYNHGWLRRDAVHQAEVVIAAGAGAPEPGNMP